MTQGEEGVFGDKKGGCKDLLERGVVADAEGSQSLNGLSLGQPQSLAMGMLWECFYE